MRSRIAQAVEDSMLRTALRRAGQAERGVSRLEMRLQRLEQTAIRRKRSLDAERDRVKRRDARIRVLEDSLVEARLQMERRGAIYE